MDAHNLANDFARKSEQVRTYVRDEFPRMAVRKSLRFIDGNFRAQGWQGRLFTPWSKNKTNTTILIKSGRLRSSQHGTSTAWEARIWNDAPYGRVHNRGFKGQVMVREHTRTTYKATTKGTGRYRASGTEKMKTIHQVETQQTVKSHLRNMNTPQRQFHPESIEDSPVLFDAIRRDLVNNILNIFK